jgi:hypothetical protein
MKKLLFVFPIVALFAAGCNSAQQAAVQTPVQTPVVATPSPSPISKPTSTPSTNPIPVAPPSIAITSPKGNVVYIEGSQQTIKWVSKNIVQVNIQLYSEVYNQDSFYSNITDSANPIKNQNTYSWLVPTSLPNGYYRIKIIDPASGVSAMSGQVAIASEAQAIKDRDDSRRAAMVQLHSSLELYHEDKNSYPATLADLVPNYAPEIPTAPEPADGSCTEQQNAYTYTLESAQSYTMSFCLGVGSEQYGAGVHILTPTGIK